MTVSYRIINDGNTEGDKIRVYTPRDGSGHRGPGNHKQIAELGRGEISQRLGAGASPQELHVYGEHGGGEYLGHPEVVVE